MVQQLLECTLRDGSYAIDFQFTASDTRLIAKGLEDAGFRLIEVGHGVGLRASVSGYGEAAATDEEYLEAAASVLTTARFGMFCIPGIARLEDVDLCATYGAKFIRIGTNVTQVPESQAFIERAKRHGMYVSANFMKSYVLPPKEFAAVAKLSREYGSDVVSLVDSAGGMLPDQLEAYVRAVRDVTDVAIGFHGHDNLGLAVANTLHLVRAGIDVADVTLQGIGRGAGNACTEMVVMLLRKAGIDLGIDTFKLMDLSTDLVRPLLTKVGRDALDLVSGYAMFHSSYMGTIRKWADRYQADPRRLIVRVCEHDMVNAPDDLVERCAKELAGTGQPASARFRLHEYHGREQDDERP